MKKTILLVEDSKVQKLAGEKLLHRAGYLVLLAARWRGRASSGEGKPS
jgi:DNA-binding NtrC family response regulator